MPITPTQNWPRKWMLEAFATALRDGYIILTPISQADAKSLTMRMIRLRRRSDKTFYLDPEYHLITIGQWSPAQGGCLPLIYDKLPDGGILPNIVSVDAETFLDITKVEPLVEVPEELAPIVLTPESLKMDEKEIGDFVKRMKKKVQQQ